jgi:hypothetical protein
MNKRVPVFLVAGVGVALYFQFIPMKVFKDNRMSVIFTTNSTNEKTALLRQVCNASSVYRYETTHYPATHALSEFMNKVDGNDECEIDHNFQNDHFPHQMQLLLRCFSYWQAKKVASPVLISKSTRKGPFLEGFYNSLQQVFQVRVIDSALNDASVKPLEPGTVSEDGFLVQSPIHVKTLRDSILRHHGFTTSAEDSCTRDPTIGIVNRHNKRKWLNTDVIPANVMTDFRSSSYLEQIRFMSEVDILISPHGAQLSSLFFMKPCSSVLELYPPGLYIPFFYGTLASAANVSHSVLYTGLAKEQEVQQTQNNVRARIQARRAPICADTTEILRWIQEQKAIRQECCARLIHM